MAKGISNKTRQIVHDRDGDVCRLCCMRRAVNLHHIVPRSRNKKLVDDPDNLISLCFECHTLVHQNTKYWIPALQRIMKGKEDGQN